MTDKHCPGCNRDLDLANFSWKNVVKGIRQVWCKQCLREANRIHYLNNTQIYTERALKRNKIINTENRKKLYAYLSEHPCIDCGCADIRCLDFDHVQGNKSANVALLLAHAVPWPRIEAEIAKCEVRCANCHRLKTGERGGWWRFLQTTAPRDDASDPHH